MLEIQSEHLHRRCGGVAVLVARLACALSVLGSVLGLPAPSRAEGVTVPLDVQAQLLTKVAAYDRSLRQRAGTAVRILIVAKPGAAESQSVAKRMASELGAIKVVAGLPLEQVTVIDFKDASGLVAACRESHFSIVYFAPGFDAEMGDIANALDGIDVLTAAAVASLVPRGVVLGFDLVAGKPQFIVFLPQAKRQNVRLAADLLRLAKVLQ